MKRKVRADRCRRSSFQLITPEIQIYTNTNKNLYSAVIHKKTNGVSLRQFILLKHSGKIYAKSTVTADINGVCALTICGINKL